MNDCYHADEKFFEKEKKENAVIINWMIFVGPFWFFAIIESECGQNLKQLFNLKPPLGFELEWTVIGRFLKDKFPGDKH